MIHSEGNQCFQMYVLCGLTGLGMDWKIAEMPVDDPYTIIRACVAAVLISGLHSRSKHFHTIYTTLISHVHVWLNNILQISEFKEQLFFAAGVSPDRLLHYSCGK